jgi:hypothetical protein
MPGEGNSVALYPDRNVLSPKDEIPRRENDPDMDFCFRNRAAGLGELGGLRRRLRQTGAGLV